MRPADLEKLLGGYATGTLTAEERQALLTAALDDQRLFDALAREEALREVLSDRTARAGLLAALDRQPAPWYRRLSLPFPAVAAAAALMMAVGAGYWTWHSRQRIAATEVAAVKPNAVPAPPVAVVEKAAPGQTGMEKPRQLARRAPAVHRATPSIPSVQTAAGAQTSSGAIGSLAPPPPRPSAGVAAPPAPTPRSTTQPVQVTAESRLAEPAATDSALVVSQPPAVAGGGGGAAGNNFRPARAPIMSALGVSASGPVRWTVLRRNDSGSFEAVGPAGLHAGDSIELRLESTVEGDIGLTEGEPDAVNPAVLLQPTHIVPGQAVVTPPVPPGAAGLRTLILRLIRREGPPISNEVRLNYR